MFRQPVLGSSSGTPCARGVLSAELEFYQSYDWCLNPYLTVSEAIGHLCGEVDKTVDCATRLADKRSCNQYISSFLWTAELHRRVISAGSLLTFQSGGG